MTEVSNRAFSSMNYFFLRAVTGKETYPESVIEEFSYFLSGLAKDLDQDPRHFSILLRSVYRDYIWQELNECDYLKGTAQDFIDQIRTFAEEHLDIDDRELEIVCKYYKDIAKEVLEQTLIQDR